MVQNWVSHFVFEKKSTHIRQRVYFCFTSISNRNVNTRNQKPTKVNSGWDDGGGWDDWENESFENTAKGNLRHLSFVGYVCYLAGKSPVFQMRMENVLVVNLAIRHLHNADVLVICLVM